MAREAGVAPPAPRLASATDPRASQAFALETPDLQSVLAHALAELVAETHAAHAAAWWAEPGGEPRVVAAAGSELPARTPTAAEYERLVALPAARDLGEVELCDAVLRDGYCAAVPVAPGDGACAVLLLGGAVDAAGRVRPRTLAALAATARRVEQPLLAALAHARLARIDADVIQLDRLVALGTLVAEVVHEVRNPLVSVKTFLQLVRERRGDPEFLQSFLDVAGEELQRIERLLDGLLEHASPPRPEPAPARAEDVAGAVAAVLRLVAHRAAAAGVALASEVGASLPTTAIAPDALRQVLLNLLVNALDVTPPDGDVRVAARATGHVLQIDVEDRGPGIPRGLRRRVFEPFFSTKPDRPGGLGLAISRRLVDEAGGRLVVSDRPGGGTRFRIRLPASA
jgi:signal transduction histidine kinase